MADEKVTTKLAVDVTDLKKGLSEANRYVRMAASEFDAATAGMDKWSSCSDGLRAKLTQLNKTLDGQEAALEVLQHEYDRVASEQGESSKSAQELQIKINKQQAAIKKTQAAINKYGNALEEVDAEADDATESTGKMSVSFDKAATAAGKLARGMAGIAGKAIVAGIKGVAAASAGLVTAFLATGEASKEYINEMGKLDAAYKTAGHSAETATQTYKTLQGVIGETDQSVEAAQQIALLAESEKDAAKWAGYAAGVVGRFGDALQPEMFYESANETLKLNEATGGYTQMLEGCGYSVEKFNEGLAACATAEEKQAYMLKITDQLLGGAAEQYSKTNAEVIRSNEANEAWAASMADVGKVALPITSALKFMGAAILSDLLPGIKELGEGFTGMLNGTEGAADKIGKAIGGLLQQIMGKLVAALPSIISAGASIVGSLVQGLITAAPALLEGAMQIVQHFRSMLPQLLQTGGEMIFKLLDGITSNLPAIAQGALNAIGGFVKGLQKNLPVVLAKGSEIIGNLGKGISKNLPKLIDQALDILMDFAETIYDNAPTIIDAGFDLLSNLVSGIFKALPSLLSKGPEIISKLANVINDNFPRILKKGVELIGQIIKGIIQAIPTLIANVPKIIRAIVDVWSAYNWLQLGKNAIKLLKDGVTSMVSAVKTAGKNVNDSIVNALKELPQKLLTLGQNAVSRLATGVKSMISSATSASKSVFNSIVNIIKSLPSQLLNLGKSAVNNIVNAVRSGASTAGSAAKSIYNGIVDAVKGLPSKMLSIGEDLVHGIWEGISGATGWLMDKISGFVKKVTNKVKDAFDIGSPSKVMAREVGRWLPAGIALGVDQNTAVAQKSMANMAKDALAAANAELNGTTLRAQVSTNGAGAQGGKAGGNTYNFYQYNTSPKPLDRKTIYRQTKNQLRFVTQL